MSALWRNQLRIGFGADRLSLALYHRGLRPSLAAQSFVPFPYEAGQADWRTALAALADALGPMQLNKLRPEATVVLSDHYVRYALLQPDPALQSRAEWQALARHRLANVQGQALEAWTVRIAQTLPEGPRIASATETALIEALQAVLSENGATLVSLQPCLMAGFNQMRARLGEAPCWLVVEEPGRITLALIERGAWRALRTRRVGAGWAHTLPQLLERECAMLGIEPLCVRAVVYAQSALDGEIHGALQCAPQGGLLHGEAAQAQLEVGTMNYFDLATVPA